MACELHPDRAKKYDYCMAPASPAAVAAGQWRHRASGAAVRYRGDTMTVPDWDEAYAASAPAPWDIGRPQSAFVRLAEQGLRTAFRDGWAVASIEAAAFELNQPGFGVPSAQAWLVVIQRCCLAYG